MRRVICRASAMPTRPCRECNRAFSIGQVYYRGGFDRLLCAACAAPSLTRTEPMRAGYTKCECGRYRRNGHACRMCARRAA